jgi:ElaB/YqjD/DUF883 family membrane-anchored ribosome-binding protein
LFEEKTIMASRQPGLPEGTDHIIDTNIDLGGGDTGGGGSSAGGGASTGGGSSGGAPKSDASAPAGTAFKFDKDEGGTKGESKSSSIAGQVREQISSLTSQAGDKAREYADEGKGKATDLLQTLASIVADATGSVEDKLGGQYAGAGRKASDAIQSFASTLDERSVDDLVSDARAFVQRSPAIAIGIAAVLGFAVARVLRSSVSQYSGDTGGSAGSTGGNAGSTGGAGNGPAA